MSILKFSGEIDTRVTGPPRGFERMYSKAGEAVARMVEWTSKCLW